MLTFIEVGTEQAADLGYGDEAYFDALQIRLDAVAKEFGTLPADVRASVRAAWAVSTCVHTMSAGASAMLIDGNPGTVESATCRF